MQVQAEDKEKATQDTVVASKLTNGDAGGSDCGCAGQDPNAAASSGSGCGCNGVSYVSSVGAGGDGAFSSWKEMKEKELSNLGPRPRVEDAVKPIDDWIRDFTKRTQLHGGLWDAARATVQPLLKKLEKTQEEAMERLKLSNKAIREHVEDAATQHIYNLLRSQRALDDAELAAEQKKQQLLDSERLLKQAQEGKEAAKESAKQMQDAYKQEKSIQDKNAVPGAKKDNTTNSIMSHIQKILAEK